jgi:hypothetical protein
MSGGGNSSYGSGGGMPLYSGGYQPQSQNQQFRSAMAYGNNRAGMMPSLKQGQPGAYGRGASSMSSIPPTPAQTGGNFGFDPFRPGGPGAGSGGMPDYVMDQPQTGGMMPANVAQQFITKPMQAPSAIPNDMRIPQDSGLHPYQPQQSAPYAAQQAQPNPLASQANALSNSVASWQNPMGMQQAQMQRIGMNPQGSAQGGYFQGNSYVPNVGNQKNGLDDLARWGMNWDGSPKQTGPFIR